FTLAGIAAYDGSRVSATIDGVPEMVTGDFVSANYFDVLGVDASVGRVLMPSDERPESPAVLGISHAYWQGRVGADRSAIGGTMLLGKIPFTIVGVTPERFHGRSVAGHSADVVLPMSAHTQLALRDHTTFRLVARLKTGVSVDRSTADLDRV